MEKIKIAELLKDCPKGMELDCTMFDDVVFDHTSNEPNTHPIYIKVKNSDFTTQLTEYGQYIDIEDAKCVIYPKGKTTWEGFIPPCKFKDGDVVFSGTNLISIFKSVKEGFSGSLHSYVSLRNNRSLEFDRDCWTLENIRQATEEEKEKLFKAIKDNGYKWNPETKTLEKLVEPKFKVGDTITNGKISFTIGYIDNEYYYEISRNIATRLYIKNQDDWDLISNKFPTKFNINTLIPFESKVLVRDNDTDIWVPAIYGYYESNEKFALDYHYYTIGSCYMRHCIPYEGNQHLLGKTDDCNEYFKTWK